MTSPSTVHSRIRSRGTCLAPVFSDLRAHVGQTQGDRMLWSGLDYDGRKLTALASLIAKSVKLAKRKTVAIQAALCT